MRHVMKRYFNAFLIGMMLTIISISLYSISNGKSEKKEDPKSNLKKEDKAKLYFNYPDIPLGKSVDELKVILNSYVKLEQQIDALSKGPDTSITTISDYKANSLFNGGLYVINFGLYDPEDVYLNLSIVKKYSIQLSDILDNINYIYFFTYQNSTNEVIFAIEKHLAYTEENYKTRFESIATGITKSLNIKGKFFDSQFQDRSLRYDNQYLEAKIGVWENQNLRILLFAKENLPGLGNSDATILYISKQHWNNYLTQTRAIEKEHIKKSEEQNSGAF